MTTEIFNWSEWRLVKFFHFLFRWIRLIFIQFIWNSKFIIRISLEFIFSAVTHIHYRLQRSAFLVYLFLPQLRNWAMRCWCKISVRSYLADHRWINDRDERRNSCNLLRFFSFRAMNQLSARHFRQSRNKMTASRCRTRILNEKEKVVKNNKRTRKCQRLCDLHIFQWTAARFRPVEWRKIALGRVACDKFHRSASTREKFQRNHCKKRKLNQNLNQIWKAYSKERWKLKMRKKWIKL